jgi:hypothetical protein
VTQSQSLTTARSALSQCTSERERWDCALELFMTESGADEGHLFLVGEDGAMELRASHAELPPPDSLLNEAGELLRGFREDAGATRLETHGAAVTLMARKPHGQGQFRPHLLWCVVSGEPTLVGVVAVRGGDETRPIGFHFLQALADGLNERALSG